MGTLIKYEQVIFNHIDFIHLHRGKRKMLSATDIDFIWQVMSPNNFHATAIYIYIKLDEQTRNCKETSNYKKTNHNIKKVDYLQIFLS